MKAKYLYFIFILISSLAIISYFCCETIVSGYLSLQWHTLNQGTIEYDNFKIKTPTNWFISSSNDRKLFLTRTTDLFDKSYHHISLSKYNGTIKNYMNFEDKRVYKDIRMRKDKTKNLIIDKYKAYYLEYTFTHPPNKKGNIWWYLILPSHNLVIQSYDTNKKYKKYTFNELIDNLHLY